MYGVRQKWLDKDGNVNPNSRNEGSVNPTLFNVEYVFLHELANGGLRQDLNLALNLRIFNKWFTQDNKEYSTNDFDNRKRFSLDESIAVAAASYRYPDPINMKKLRIWTSQTWFRFYDVVPFLYLCKYPKTKFLGIFQFLVMIFSIQSCLKPAHLTSGALLAFVSIHGLDMKITRLLCTWALKRKGSSWEQAFQTYFPEHNHPINVLAREVYLDINEEEEGEE